MRLLVFILGYIVILNSLGFAGYQDFLGYKASSKDILYINNATNKLSDEFKSNPKSVIQKQENYKKELHNLSAAKTLKQKQKVFYLKRLIDEIYLMSAESSNQRILREGELLMEGGDFDGAYLLYKNSKKDNRSDDVWMDGFLQSALATNQRESIYLSNKDQINQILKRNNNFHLILNLYGLDSKQVSKSITWNEVKGTHFMIVYLLNKYIEADPLDKDSLKQFIENNKEQLKDLNEWVPSDYIRTKDFAKFWLNNLSLMKKGLLFYDKSAQLYPTYATYQSLGIAYVYASCSTKDIEKFRSKSRVMILSKDALEQFDEGTKKIQEYCIKFTKDKYSLNNKNWDLEYDKITQ